MSPQALHADWLEGAACDGMDPELFFPSKGPTAPQQVREAKAVCATCPVRLACLEYALSVPEHWGVWGGTTEKERQRIRARRRGAAA